MACVVLKKGEGRGLSAGGSWIYDNEIERIDGAYEEGGMVGVAAANGYPLGQGYINTRSRITVRMLTRDGGAVTVSYTHLATVWTRISLPVSNPGFRPRS